MVMGTIGVVGAADGTYILMRDNRLSAQAILNCNGRDIESKNLKLEFDKQTCLWNFIDSDNCDLPELILVPPFINCIIQYMSRLDVWKGTPTQLLEELKDYLPRDYPVVVNTVTRYLNQFSSYLSENSIKYDYRRSSSAKTIILRKLNDECDDNVDKTLI